jgi:hypothetical protein
MAANKQASTRWSAKRRRQYEHVKESALDRGESEDSAEEIAARTVNKERARHGESVTASASSVDDILALEAVRSRTSGRRTYRQLYSEARQRNIQGRSHVGGTGRAVDRWVPARLSGRDGGTTFLLDGCEATSDRSRPTGHPRGVRVSTDRR